MTDWVQDRALTWGHWCRKADKKDKALQGTIGRIYELGPDGALVKQYGQKIPITDFPPEVKEFHLAWIILPPQHRAILFVDYRLTLPAYRKFELVNKGKNAYYRARRNALTFIEQFLDRN